MHNATQKYRSLTTGKPVFLTTEISSGGEGTIWRLSSPELCAKIYHTPTTLDQEKLRWMLRWPPEDPTGAARHPSIAWPQDLLLNEDGHIVGFVMSRALGAHPLNYAYHPRLRATSLPTFTWKALHVTALNCAWIMRTLHQKGYCLGDVRPENFLVTPRALVTVIDVDSFQIPYRDHPHAENLRYFTCSAATPAFTAPEVHGLPARERILTPAQDVYGLAILLYVLLMGVHPFHGCWEGEGEMPTLESLMRRGMTHFMTGSALRPGPLTPAFTLIHPALQQCFEDALAGGIEVRPSPDQWIRALEKAIQELTVCEFNSQHIYSNHRERCPWCALRAEGGVELFPHPQGESPEKVWGDACLRAFEKGDLPRARYLLQTYPIIHRYAPLLPHLQALEQAASA